MANNHVVRFGDKNGNGNDSSDTVESSPEDFAVGVVKAESWSDVDDLEEDSAEGDDEDNDGFVLRRKR
jgi:hypothetical protein